MSEPIDSAWLDTHEWGLRSERPDRTAYEGFRWKRLGAWTRCEEWRDDDRCGGGLHYEAPECHGSGMMHAVPVLVETRGPRRRVGEGGGGKMKSPEARVVARGADIPDEAFERCGYRVVRAGSATVQSGGRCYAYGTASVTVQAGGRCYAYGTASVTVQDGGRCDAYGTASVTVQAGGWCDAFGTATVVEFEEREEEGESDE